MEIVHLDKDCLYKALAKECSWDHDDADCWHETMGTGCPFGASEDEDTVDCKAITAAHWCEVFEGRDAEPEPEAEPKMQFSFGDKVTVMMDPPCESIFSAYTGGGKAFVLFEGEYFCEEVQISDLKAGWNG